MNEPMEEQPLESPNVFRYLDARRFLGDYYRYKKSSTRSFSYRAFSRRAGLKSPNYLKLVIDGERNLTADTAHRFGQACGLDGQELSYFLDLVAFTQAKTTDSRSARYERLIRFRQHREIHRIDIAFGQYHSMWFIPAIRELAFRDDFRDDPGWIAHQLLPNITDAEARQAVRILLELELLADRGGRIRPTETLITTGPEVKGMHYVQYHRAMMTRALSALDEIPAADRDISSVTLCLAADGIQRLKERIRAFRRELLDLSAQEQDLSQVVQVNFQLFPLSKAKSVDASEDPS